MLIKLMIKAPNFETMLTRCIMSGWVVAQTAEDTVDLLYVKPIARC